MKKQFKMIIILIFLNCSIFANEKITLQLSWLHQFQFAGYYMAKEKGFYKEAGIDIDIQEYQFGLDLSSILDKKANFSIGRSSLLVDKFQGRDVVALAAIFQKSPLMLLVTQNSGIETIEDLKNKKIMITSDAKSSASIIAMLTSNGIKLDDIVIQKHSFNLDDLISGKTDAMASYVSNEPIRLADQNINYKIFHPNNYGFRFYDDILYTSSKFMKENPVLTKRFFDASLKGWKYAFENITESAEVIYKKYNTQNKTLLQFVKEGEILKQLAYDRQDHKIGCLDEKVLEKIVDTYKVLGLITDDVNLEEFIYEHNPHQIYNFELTNKDIVLITIIATLVIIMFVFLLVYTSIKRRWLVTNNQLKEEIKEARKELQTQKDYMEYQYKKLNSIINNTDAVIIFKDENLNYLECNSYFANLFGKKVEDIIGKNDFYLFEKEIAENFRKQDNDVVESKEEKTLTNWVKFPSIKEEQLFHSLLKPFEYEKGKVGLIIFASNITKQHQLENENLKNQKLLSKHSKILAISKLLGNIAHQWRQPLSSISMTLNNIHASLDLKEDVKKEEIIADIDKAKEQTQYLSRIIDDFTQYFHSDVIELTTIDTKLFFNKLDSFLDNEFKENKVQLVEKIESTNFDMNSNLLIQSLINIYRNSIDAFNSNEINEEDRYIFTTVKDNNESILITIKDSGDGIKDEIIEHIFEPYSTTKHKYVGVGLSLYITYHIVVDQLNGTIEVQNSSYVYENKELKGAEFIINIPKE